LGQKLAKSLFPAKNPMGEKVKIGGVWLQIIGLVSRKSASEELGNLPGVRNINTDVFIPHRTFKLHYVRRDVVTKRDLARGNRNRVDENLNIAEVDKLIIRVSDTEKMPIVAEVIKKMLKRRHNDVEDFRVIVPELLLDQERSTKQIFNIVLSVIASISLIVGGIGIMNIMFSSVMERTKEIGIRRAVGATEIDIQLQFIIEAVTISFSGGIIGIILGLGMSVLIQELTDIKTIVQLNSVFISFFVSIAVGFDIWYNPS
jgi:putative ABC transport system permease protein